MIADNYVQHKQTGIWYLIRDREAATANGIAIDSFLDTITSYANSYTGSLTSQEQLDCAFFFSSASAHATITSSIQAETANAEDVIFLRSHDMRQFFSEVDHLPPIFQDNPPTDPAELTRYIALLAQYYVATPITGSDSKKYYYLKRDFEAAGKDTNRFLKAVAYIITPGSTSTEPYAVFFSSVKIQSATISKEAAPVAIYSTTWWSVAVLQTTAAYVVIAGKYVGDTIAWAASKAWENLPSWW